MRAELEGWNLDGERQHPGQRHDPIRQCDLPTAHHASLRWPSKNNVVDSPASPSVPPGRPKEMIMFMEGIWVIRRVGVLRSERLIELGHAHTLA